MIAQIWLKRALLLIIIGLIVQLFCLVHVTPGTFVVFAVGGVGPLLLGLGAFAYAMRSAHRQGGEAQDEA